MAPDDLQQIADDYNYPIELIGADKGQTFEPIAIPNQIN